LNWAIVSKDSHIILILLISIYLIWVQRHQLALDDSPFHSGGPGGLQTQDYLASVTLASLTILWGGRLSIFAIATLRAVTFPLLFLVFIVPFPMSLEQHLRRTI